MTIILAANVKKGETPTTLNGLPDNFFLVGFLNESDYQKALDNAWKNGRNLIKEKATLSDHVLLSDSTVMTTSNYLDAVHGFGSGRPAKALYRITKNRISDFDLSKAKSEVLWYGNH